MKNFVRMGRTLSLTAVLAVGAVCWMGCVTGTEPEGGGGNNCGTDGTDGSCKTTVIGGQTWMAENLNYQTGNSWCYNDSNSYCRKYGRLYDWETAKAACQAVGWRLPDTADRRILVNAVGDYDGAGKKLKSKSGWNDYLSNTGNGTDNFGFSALPGGMTFEQAIAGGGYRNTFDRAGYNGYWWMTTENSDRYGAYILGMDYSTSIVNEGWKYKDNGFSVRCVRE
jgi:uncharacterized protein (TIGR02145 family)